MKNNTRIIMDRNLAIGVDIGGSHVSSAVIDLRNGSIIGEPQSVEIAHTASAEEIFSAWTTDLRLTINQGCKDVRQVGMAFPGPFDYEKGISHMEHKFVSIKGLEVGRILQDRMLEFPGLEFRFVNDAGAFALGESNFGAAKGMGKVLVLTLGTGLGSGFIEDNKVVRTGGYVPEGGEVWNLPFEDGIADEAFSTRWVVKRWKELTGQDVPGARDVAIRCGFDENARRLFTEFGSRLAEFTIPLLKNFGCSNVLLGGNISRNLNNFADAMQRRYGQGGMSVTVKASTLLDRAAMFGAASLFA